MLVSRPVPRFNNYQVFIYNIWALLNFPGQAIKITKETNPMNNDRPSLFRILVIDYISFMSFLVPLVAWFVYFLAGPHPDSTVLIASICLTGAAVPLFLWRVYYFLRMFDAGVQTPAIIQKFLYTKSRGRIEYTYNYQGEEYYGHDNVYRYTGVREIALGLQVTALVDPNNPQKAVIKDLFAKRQPFSKK
jgi:hypothetical protein